MTLFRNELASRINIGANKFTLRWGLAILLVASLLMLAGCSDDPQPATPTPQQATATPVPNTHTPVPATPTPEPDVVDQLKKNAEEFEYAVGKHGGTLTFATISEPLTFNLAIANDASSSGVLGALFEGLTEVSWLTDEVEPALAESLGPFGRRLDLDILHSQGRHVARRRTLHRPRRGLYLQPHYLQPRHTRPAAEPHSSSAL